jgi:prepilin-type N-terminal cleavage/methylation domain-containing protein
MARIPARRRRSEGFTLIEVMIVVALIGVLASMSGPNFLKFAFKSRRVEAFHVLEDIHMAQVEHLTDFGFYADTFDDLGFTVANSKKIDARTLEARNYTFSMYSVNDGMNFLAMANGNIDPLDDTPDILVIQNDLTIVQ